MANQRRTFTKEQRATIQPLLEKLERAYDEVERAVATAIPRDDPDAEFGFCVSCPRPGREELCSSFLGPGKTLREPCQREFCKHSRMFHF